MWFHPPRALNCSISAVARKRERPARPTPHSHARIAGTNPMQKLSKVWFTRCGRRPAPRARTTGHGKPADEPSAVIPSPPRPTAACAPHDAPRTCTHLHIGRFEGAAGTGGGQAEGGGGLETSWRAALQPLRGLRCETEGDPTIICRNRELALIRVPNTHSPTRRSTCEGRARALRNEIQSSAKGAVALAPARRLSPLHTHLCAHTRGHLAV